MLHFVYVTKTIIELNDSRSWGPGPPADAWFRIPWFFIFGWSVWWENKLNKADHIKSHIRSKYRIIKIRVVGKLNSHLQTKSCQSHISDIAFASAQITWNMGPSRKCFLVVFSLTSDKIPKSAQYCSFPTSSLRILCFHSKILPEIADGRPKSSNQCLI